MRERVRLASRPFHLLDLQDHGGRRGEPVGVRLRRDELRPDAPHVAFHALDDPGILHALLLLLRRTAAVEQSQALGGEAAGEEAASTAGILD